MAGTPSPRLYVILWRVVGYGAFPIPLVRTARNAGVAADGRWRTVDRQETSA